jgi:hypothetical protein
LLLPPREARRAADGNILLCKTSTQNIDQDIDP